MLVTFDLHTYYDWEPLPKHVVPSEEDIKKKIVKPAANNDGWLMRVERSVGDNGETTDSQWAIPEHQIVEQIVQDWIKLKMVHTRTEAAAQYLARHCMPHAGHRSWMTDVHVECDDGPDLALFTTMVAEQVACGSIEELDVQMLAEAYTADTTEEVIPHPPDASEEQKKQPPRTCYRAPEGHQKKHLSKHFGIKPKKRENDHQSKPAAPKSQEGSQS